MKTEEVVSSADVKIEEDDSFYDYETDKDEGMQPAKAVSSADVKIEKDDKYDYDTDKEYEDMQSSTVKLEKMKTEPDTDDEIMLPSTNPSANSQSKYAAITPSPGLASGNVMEVDNDKLVIEQHMNLPTLPIQPKERPVQAASIVAYNKPTSRNIHSTPVIMTKHTPFSTCPELESYLVANEGGYLRGGSSEQANFNTKLTKGLMKLAESLNYIFDEQVYKDLPCLRTRVLGFYRSRRDTRRRRGSGVTQTQSGKWQAQTTYNGKAQYIGIFDSEQTARSAVTLVRDKLSTSDGTTYEGEELKAIIKCVRDAVRVDKKNSAKKKKKKSAAVPKTVSVTVHVENDYGLSIVDGKSEKIVWIESIEPNTLLDGTILKKKMILRSVNGVEYPDCDSFHRTLISLKGGNNVTIVASIPTREELKDFPTKSKAKSKRRTSAQANLQEPQATKSLAKRRKKDDGIPNFFSALGDSPLPRRASSPTYEELKTMADAFDSKSSSSHPKKKKKTVVITTTPLDKAMIKAVNKDWNKTQRKMFTFALDNGFCGEWEKVAVLVDSKSAAECEEYYNRHMKMKQEVEKKHGGKWKEAAVELLGDKAKKKKDDKEKKKKVIYDLT